MSGLYQLAESASAESSPPAAFSMLLVLVSLVLWSGHALHRYSFITDGSLAMISGLLAGGGFYFYYEHIKAVHIPATLVAFNYDIYMHLLLPPIIFYAGFSIKKKYFFQNLGALATMGVLGTMLLSAVLAVMFAAALQYLGLDTKNIVGNCMALGTVFASADSVATLQALDSKIFPLLHALVFGEAVLNDAVAIVLLRAEEQIGSQGQLTLQSLGAIFSNFVNLSVLSMALGVGAGLVCSFILKNSFRKRHSTDHEVSLLAAFGFLSYLLAECTGLTGVYASFFCGLTMSHYAWHSLSPSAKVSSIYAFRMLSFLAELVMFLCCGLDLWSTQLWHGDMITKKKALYQMTSFALWISIAVPIGRFLVAMPLVLIINTFRVKSSRFCWRNAVALSWGGCARGAVTLALAVNYFLGSDRAGGGKEVDEEGRIIAVSAMLAVVFSTVVLGGVTPAFFSKLLKPVLERADGHRPASEPHPGPASKPPLPVRKMYISAAEMADSDHGGGILQPLMSAEGQAQHAQHDRLPRRLARIQEDRSARFEADRLEGATTATDQQRQNSQATSKSTLHAAWNDLDKRVLQPLFGGRSLSLYRQSFRADSQPPSPRTSSAQSIEYGLTNLPGSAAGWGSPFSTSTETRNHRFNPNISIPGDFIGDLEPGPHVHHPSQLFSVARQSVPKSDAVLDELFAKPGMSKREYEQEIDTEVEIEGLVDQAENFLER